MTLRRSARWFARISAHPRAQAGVRTCRRTARHRAQPGWGNGGTGLDAGVMSISTSACFEFAASKPRRRARKSNSHGFLGSAAVAGLVLGCAWTVYANILAANVYPTLGSVSYDTPVSKATTILPR